MNVNEYIDFDYSYRTLVRAEEACTHLREARAKLGYNNDLVLNLADMIAAADQYVVDYRAKLIAYLTEHGKHVRTYTPPLHFAGGPRVRDEYDCDCHRYCIARGGNEPDSLTRLRLDPGEIDNYDYEYDREHYV